MDRREARERMRRKRREMRRRKLFKLATCLVAAVLLVVFVVRGIILPIVRQAGGKNAGGSEEVQAETVKTDPDAATRLSLKDSSGTDKAAGQTPGWQENGKGRWYQNQDDTYYAGGFEEIDGVTYYFSEDGYVQTGWVTRNGKDYYFNEDGSYDATKKKPMLALTFDDGPGPYTDELLDCLEENGAHATFFMVGQNVGNYQSSVKRMAELGCEIGSHSWDHADLTTLSLEEVAKEFEDTDNALIEACGQAASVARPPYGNWNEEILNTIQKPVITWSVDSRDWDYKDEEKDYNSVLEGDLSDGSIILMHDIYEPTVKMAERLIPELISQGYKLVTVSEMAEAKGVTLQIAGYTDFWKSSFEKGRIAGAPAQTSGESGGTEDGSVSDGGSETTSDSGISDGGDDASGDSAASGEV